MPDRVRLTSAAATSPLAVPDHPIELDGAALPAPLSGERRGVLDTRGRRGERSGWCPEVEAVSRLWGREADARSGQSEERCHGCENFEERANRSKRVFHGVSGSVREVLGLTL